MSRYIDRDVFLKKIEHFSLSHGTTLGKHSGVADEIIDILMAQPTADVVEVVRCRDCKYFLTDDDTMYCERATGLDQILPDDFCSYGERRTEE